MGKAKVYVDGVLKLTADGYAKRARWNVRRSLTGLADRVHTVTVTVTDNHGRVGTDTTVVTVANVAPAFEAGPDRTAVEDFEHVAGPGPGALLGSFSFTDPGADYWTGRDAGAP